MTRTRIRGANVVLPDGIEQVDVIIDGTTIAHVDPPEGAACDETIDATGLHLMPGVVDAHVHFREPGLTHKEDIYTASRAGAAGGVTSFVEMPNTIPNATSQAHIEEKLALAAKKAVVNYGFYIGATSDNVTELSKAHRVAGIKIFVGSSTGDLLVDKQEDLERIFAETTLPICTHAEDESTVRANRERIGTPQSVHDHSRIRDHRAAEICVRRLVELAERHEHHLHILHVSTANEVEILAETGALVTAEACPHHLLLSIDDYDELGTLGQMNPSLKTKEDNEALWQALRDGVMEMVATDHAPHLLEEKAKPYPESPSGMPGVQTFLPLMLDAAANGRCTLEQLVDWMADAPARIWNMVNKGRIEEGYDADLVLVDLEKRKTVRNEDQLSKCGWSAFDGRELQGWPVRTFVMGRQVFGDDTVTTEALGHEIQYKQDQ